MRHFALAAALFVLAPATVAQAGVIGPGTLGITFDLSGSSVSVASLIDIPPAGTVTSASAQLSLSASGSMTPLSGPAAFQSLTLAATIDAPPIFGASLSGSVSANQMGVADAMLTAGLANLVVNPPIAVDVNALLNCMGSCAFIEGLLMDTFPVTLTGVQDLGVGFTVMVGNLASPGLATVFGEFTFTVANLPVTVTIAGTEVSRSFSGVPEPSSAVLLGGALVGLASLVRLRRR